MSQQGIRGYYQLTEKIREQLNLSLHTNTISIGDISQVNLNKQDIFPLAHMIVNSVIAEENVLRFNLSILACDIVDQSKDETINRFTGNDNEQDILNTQLAVLNTLIQRLRKGELHQDMYQLSGNPTLTPFHDRFENQLAGWSATIEILIYNDINIC
ncbi:hypothetical protein [uncultured Wocania sp.]|uniref:hypothetical protein n=1 Tax=uncultured Wocania sp. TaxID=2834404 RepID=UPI0030F76898